MSERPVTIDAHNDAIVSNIRRGGVSVSGAVSPDLARREGTVAYLRGSFAPAELDWHGQIDLPKMAAGGIDAAFFAVDVTRAWKNNLAYALDAFGFFLADLGAHSDQITVARSAAEIRAAQHSGRRAAVLVVENSDALEGSLNVLEVFHRIGVRSITLTHNPSSWAAAGNGENASGGGLTRFGVALVREMNHLGMLVDVSHVSERGFFDTLGVTESPVIASHSCCAALCPHPRNLTDSQLRALAQQDGVVCITFVPSFVDPDWRDEDWPRVPSVEKLLDHVDHAVRVAGIDHVGIGSDFDGGGTVLRDAAEFPRLSAGLAARGYGQQEIAAIMGENVFRLLEATMR